MHRRPIKFAAVLAVAVWGMVAGYAHADFQSERHWRPEQAERLLRTYTGLRRKTSYGPGWSVEYFIGKYGRPDERRRISDQEELLIYRGKKQLYRGSGASNAAIGPEWREYRVRSGQVIDETEAIQMVEMRNAITANVETTCEDYGGTNTSVCLDVAPAGALPQAVAPPAEVLDYGCRSDERAPPLGQRSMDESDVAALRELVATKLASALGLKHQLIPSRRTTGPMFVLGMQPRANAPGSEALAVVTRHCKRSVGLSVLREGREVGELTIGICDRVDEITWSDTCAARSALAEAVRALELDRNNPTLRQMGVPPQIDKRRDGSLLEYFPAIVVGHGLTFLRTSILIPADSRQSVMIQANLDNACTGRPSWDFCAGAAGELARLQTELAERFLSRR